MKNLYLRFSITFFLFFLFIPVGAVSVSVGKWRLDIDNATGKTNIYQSDVLLVPNSQCAFLIGNTKYFQEQLTVRDITLSILADQFGSGKLVRIISNTPTGTFSVTQNYYLYSDKEYILTDFSVESAQILSSNYMSPVNSTTPSSFLPGTNNRTLAVPFDNDKWVRYNSLNFGVPSTSYEVGVVYNTATRQGLVVGSVEHTLWKTGINTSTNTTGSLLSLEVFGGITDRKSVV